MKYKLLFFFLSIFYVNSYSQTHIRANYAGYYTSQEKNVIVISKESLINKEWKITNKNGLTILSGNIQESICSVNSYTPYPFNYKIDFSEISTSGIYTISIPKIASETVVISNNPTAFLPSELLQGFRVRRSGTDETIVHLKSHVGDTSCIIYRRVGTDNKTWQADANSKKVNMLGGWYDAGDYIKFTHTIAYSTYLLCESYNTLPQLYNNSFVYSKSDLPDLLDEIKFGLDYLLKCMPDDNEFIIQTGGHLDHEQWPLRLPENDKLDGKRECYSALSQTQMALTTAALSVGYSIFKDILNYQTFADSCKTKAITIYEAAKASNIHAAYWKNNDQTYYGDDFYNDNFALAAINLFEITQDNTYKTEAENYANNMGTANWASWGEFNLLALKKIIQYNPTMSSKLETELNYYNTIKNTPGNVWSVPHKSTWASLYSYIEVGCAALFSENELYTQIGVDVNNYTLGCNSWGAQFIPTQKLASSISDVYATIYKLNPSVFPTGDIAEGPTDLSTLNDNKQWFDPAHNTNLWHTEFNTSELAFFEESGNYVCMETTISGIADAIYFFTLSTKYFGGNLEIDCKGILGGNAIINNCDECQYLNNTCNSTKLNVVQNNVQYDKNYCTIYNYLGQVMYIGKWDNSITQSNNFPKGVYIVKFIDSHQNFKLIK